MVGDVGSRRPQLVVVVAGVAIVVMPWWLYASSPASARPLLPGVVQDGAGVVGVSGELEAVGLWIRANGCCVPHK